MHEALSSVVSPVISPFAIVIDDRRVNRESLRHRLRLLSDQENADVIYPYKKDLTEDQVRTLDIEFFNLFESRLENPGMRARRQTIHRHRPRPGLKSPWLADHLFVFDQFAIPQRDPGYEKYYARLKHLADAGNASAQCLIADLLGNYNIHHNAPPGKNIVSAEEYRARAIDSGHPRCLGYPGQ